MGWLPPKGGTMEKNQTRGKKFGPDDLAAAFRTLEAQQRERDKHQTEQFDDLLGRKEATFVPDRVTRDFDKLTLATMGFTIRLGEENVDCYLPVDQFVSKMPAEDKRLLEKDPNSFTSRYSQVMIQTARDRHQKKALGSAEEMQEHFDENKYTRAQTRVLKELRAEIRG